MSARRLWVSLVGQAAAALGAIITIVAWDADRELRWTLGVVVVGGLATTSTLLTLEYFTHRAKRYPTPAKINRFMHGWISQRGRIAIFSNDMTWVSEEVYVSRIQRAWLKLTGRKTQTIKELLLAKAGKGELKLCLPRSNALSQELEAAGATVSTYEALGLIPKSRFTIVRFGQQGAAVAIGRPDPDLVHRIEVFSEGHHPAFAMAQDLVDFVTRYDEAQ
jgi:hypothetical protein